MKQIKEKVVLAVIVIAEVLVPLLVLLKQEQKF